MNTIVLQFDNVFVFVHLLRCLYLGILWLKWVSAGLCVSLWGTGGDAHVIMYDLCGPGCLVRPL